MEGSGKKKEESQEPISAEERARQLKIQQKKDARNVYKPLIKTIKKVIDGLGKLERDIPIYKIARMDIDGVFSKKRHAKMRKSVLGYLKKANTYRKTIWTFQKTTKKLFDEEMLKNGSSAPGLSEYESLRNQLPGSILDENGKVWSMSFDTYLPKIIEHSPKKKGKPIKGTQMFMLIEKKSKKTLGKIKKLQVQSVVAGQELVEDLKIAMKSPDKEWLEWRQDVKTKGKNSKL
jgi:hypothetical protein